MPCNLKDERFYHFCLIFMKNTKNQAKILQSCFLQIAISQDWIGGFLISERPWVRKACGQILKPRRSHNLCKCNFYVTKTSKTHLRLYSHSTATVCLLNLLFECQKITHPDLLFQVPLSLFQVW